MRCNTPTVLTFRENNLHIRVENRGLAEESGVAFIHESKRHHGNAASNSLHWTLTQTPTAWSIGRLRYVNPINSAVNTAWKSRATESVLYRVITYAGYKTASALSIRVEESWDIGATTMRAIDERTLHRRSDGRGIVEERFRTVWWDWRAIRTRKCCRRCEPTLGFEHIKKTIWDDRRTREREYSYLEIKVERSSSCWRWRRSVSYTENEHCRMISKMRVSEWEDSESDELKKNRRSSEGEPKNTSLPCASNKTRSK